VHSAEKVHDTTLNDEKYEVHRDQECAIGKHMTDGTPETPVVTALCNPPKAFASDLGNDQSRYLFVSVSAKGMWTEEENDALSRAVKECLAKYRGSKTVNVFRNLPWTEIAEKVPTKTNDQCRSRWLVSMLASHNVFIY